MTSKQTNSQGASRRQFLKTTAASATLAANLGMLSNVHAAGSDVIKVGLIGCGGRGSGAAENVLSAAPNIQLYAMGDVFKDKLDGCRRKLETFANREGDNLKKAGNSINCPDERCFVGFDAYEKVLGSGIDYVILATPPGFRPQHLEAAVAAGKNIFTEKPVATDAAGIRKVLAAYELAAKKKLQIAAGTQRRHQASYIDTIKEIQDGKIGDIVNGRCYWNQGHLWVHKRQKGWSDMEYQLRNWYQFVWICGDHIVEQHVHNLDVINWVLNAHPVRAVGMGGRQVRVQPEYGQIYDHFAVDYEYPNGIHVLSMCRQTDGCENNVSEAVVGTKGTCDFRNMMLRDHSGKTLWRRQRSGERDANPYVQEHTDLIESIRGGKYLNELKQVAESTLTAIMGRMSTYTGKAVTWDKAMTSKEDLFPAKLGWDVSMPENPPVAMPGKTPLV